jgi:hypothetical protein
MKKYVTFGPAHRVEFNEKIFDNRCVCVINYEDESYIDYVLTTAFNNCYLNIYSEEEWNPTQEYPRGYVVFNHYIL